MKIDITFKGDMLIMDSLKKLKDIEKSDILDKLENDIKNKINELKIELLRIVNVDIKSEPIELPEGDEITISKSKETIINEVFDVNLDDVRKANNFDALIDSSVCMITNVRGNYVTSVQLDINKGDSFLNHYGMASNFFNDKKTVFMFIDGDKVNYFMNPGYNLNEYVKIFCSTETGDTKESRHKFSLDERKRDKTIWRLTDEGAKFIVNNFINISDIAENIEQGKYNTAKIKLNNRNIDNERIKDIDQKVDNIKNKDSIKDETLSHVELIDIINNLSIERKTTNKVVTFELISKVSDTILSNNDVWNKIQTNVAVWKVLNYTHWINFLKQRVDFYLKSL